MRRLRCALVPYLLILPGGLWLVVFFAAPLIFLISMSTQTGDVVSGFTQTFDLHNYVTGFSDYHSQFIRSLLYGGLATVLCIVLSYPTAYWIAFRGGARKSTYLFLILLPFFVSFVLRTISWQYILGDNGLLLEPLKSLGLLPQNFRVLATSTAVVGGLTYNYLPFMVLPIYVALERIDFRVVEAAYDLYASRVQAFTKVILPLSLPGVFAGVLLNFVPAASDYVNAEVLGGPNNTMIGNIIQDEFLNLQNYPIGAALSFTLMAILLIGIFIYAKALGTDQVLEAAPRECVGSAPPGARHPPPRPPPPPRRRPRKRVGDRLLFLYTWVVIVWLALPIAAVMLFSFNNPRGRFNYSWVGFTFKWWGPKLFEYPSLTKAMVNSIIIGVLATLLATVLGTFVGLALGKYRFRGQGATNLVQFAAISAPEIVLGSSLLTFFITLRAAAGLCDDPHRAHRVLPVVRGRHRPGAGADPGPLLEEAARDLGAGPWTTFRLVTLPMIWPGVLAGALLAFALSIDDFVTTNFVSGPKSDLSAVDLGRHQGRPAPAGRRDGNDHFRGRGADRRHLGAPRPSRYQVRAGRGLLFA